VILGDLYAGRKMKRRKLPVFRTVGRAYGFFFRKFFGIIHVGWFGITVLAFLVIGSMYYDANPELAKNIFWVGGSFIGQIASIIVGVVIFIGLAKVYFNRPREKGMIYFTIDKSFWRFVVANILTYLLFILWTTLFVFIEIAAAVALSNGDLSLLLQNPEQFVEKLW